MITDVLIDPFRYLLGVALLAGAGFVAGALAAWWYLTSLVKDRDS